MPTALIQINDGVKPCSPLIRARPRPATGRPRRRSGAAVEGQADPASDISSTPRPVGLVGRLVAKHYHVKQHTWQASRHLGRGEKRAADMTGAAARPRTKTEPPR